jgi:hypothetical protein
MHSKTIASLILALLLLSGCARSDIAPTALPQENMTAGAERVLLTFADLMDGFEAASPVDESALAPPPEAASAQHIFEGILTLSVEDATIQMEMLRGELEPEYRTLPPFEIEFVQVGDHLVPVQRASVLSEHPAWNYIIGPGRVWQEDGDQGFARASFPFALVVKGGNATFNGTMSFLFDDQKVSQVWFQVTQETTTYTRVNMWGLVEAAYQPESLENGEQVRAAFETELANRFPTRPIEALQKEYPEIDPSAFGRGVTPEHMTWYGFVVEGVNYVGGCQTRFGIYPYCESMRATSYSTAKSAFVSVALMRLAQIYDPEVANLLIKDYLPETAASPGNWDVVTFNHTLDMSTGNYRSPSRMVDEDGEQMNEFFGIQPYAKRMAIALDWPNANQPGQQWVYRTSDTFILTRAMQNYLQTQRAPDADIFDFVVDEVYQPLRMEPGVMSSMRTADDDWHGQAEGGYGIWWVPDDIAKITTLLNNGGQFDGVQLLHPDLLAAALQQNPDDRGVKIGTNNMYNNAFWATRYLASGSMGYECEFWVPTMQGVSGNVVALFPNGTAYYYFSDNQEFTWEAPMREANKLIAFCE